jgi:hypothetical protein
MTGGLMAEIVAGWPDFRASMRRRIAGGLREDRILALIFLAGFAGFVAGLPGAVAEADRLGVERAGVVGGRFFAAVFGFPLLAYGLAALGFGLVRLAGGQGPWINGRAALAWALVLAIPLLAPAPLAVLAGASDGVVQGIGLAAFGGFLWIWACCLAESAGLTRALPLFAAMLAPPGIFAAILTVTGQTP